MSDDWKLPKIRSNNDFINQARNQLSTAGKMGLTKTGRELNTLSKEQLIQRCRDFLEQDRIVFEAKMKDLKMQLDGFLSIRQIEIVDTIKNTLSEKHRNFEKRCNDKIGELLKSGLPPEIIGHDIEYLQAVKIANQKEYEIIINDAIKRLRAILKG